jgi:hypothetical protein
MCREEMEQSSPCQGDEVLSERDREFLFTGVECRAGQRGVKVAV